jgi:hypothetical protein
MILTAEFSTVVTLIIMVNNWYIIIITPTKRVSLAVTLLTRIRKVFGSNLARDTGYRDRLFVAFLSPSKKAQPMTKYVAIKAFG